MNLTVTTHQAEEDIRNEQLKIYVNGEIIPKLEAKISVFDSGFMSVSYTHLTLPTIYSV